MEILKILFIKKKCAEKPLIRLTVLRTLRNFFRQIYRFFAQITEQIEEKNWLNLRQKSTAIKFVNVTH